jgi:hypothetical protein
MTVVDIAGAHEVKNVRELEAVLMRRYKNDLNAFWLAHRNGEYPTLSLLVKEDLASLNYIPKEHVAGLRSVGNMPHLNSGETTRFSISNNSGDDLFVLNDAVLPFSAALRAAKEFFFSEDPPQSIEWLQL